MKIMVFVVILSGGVFQIYTKYSIIGIKNAVK